MKDKILIIGGGAAGLATAAAFAEKGIKTEIISPEKELDMSNVIEINGERWQLIERERPRRYGLTSVSAMAYMLAGLANASFGNSYSRPAPKVNVVEEFKLIQQKKSKLSKRDRDWVVSQFLRNFRRLEKNATAA